MIKALRRGFWRMLAWATKDSTPGMLEVLYWDPLPKSLLETVKEMFEVSERRYRKQFDKEPYNGRKTAVLDLGGRRYRVWGMTNEFSMYINFHLAETLLPAGFTFKHKVLGPHDG